MKIKNIVLSVVCGLLTIAIVTNLVLLSSASNTPERLENCVGDGEYIKWVEFDPPYSALERALKVDIDTYQKDIHISWVTILSYLSASYWGEWSKYRSKDMDAFVEKVSGGEQVEVLAKDLKHFDYYSQAYDAILGGMVSEYKIGTGEVRSGEPVLETKYGLKAYSPIAYGYSYNHYDDFGNSRSYGYRRPHTGNDLLSSIGTPIVAVESGIITNLGWNQYGGWRVGIRSLDGKRYYYYAHLRKDHPFAPSLTEGTLVNAGELIGYVGMTGYSTKENFNGMTVPHLHFGLQLVFDESQLEGNNEIWVDVYNIVKLLEKHKSPLIREEGAADYQRKYAFIDPATEEHLMKYRE